MTTVKIITGTPGQNGVEHASRHWYAMWRRMATDTAAYSYGCFRIVDWDYCSPDYILVINHPGADYLCEWPYRVDRTILIQMEPPIVHRSSWGLWTDPMFHQKLAYAHTIETRHMGIDWYVDIPATQLQALHPVKNRVCSAVLSWKSHHPGHKLRLALVNNWLRGAEWFDLYGTICRTGQPKHPRYCGQPPMRAKETAIEPYMYHLCVENCQWPNYWTEKITDAILCEALPLYWGCPNLTEWLPEGSYVTLPLEHPDVAAMAMERYCSDPRLWQLRLPYILEAKQKILDELNVFACIDRALRGV